MLGEISAALNETFYGAIVVGSVYIVDRSLNANQDYSTWSLLSITGVFTIMRKSMQSILHAEHQC